jgi:hypothetical protein
MSKVDVDPGLLAVDLDSESLAENLDPGSIWVDL